MDWVICFLSSTAHKNLEVHQLDEGIEKIQSGWGNFFPKFS